jgi:ATPase subunit of ABC transporter with duplicated ATPase domains
MRSKEKIVINGFNGIGKSTFLKTILGIVPKISGEYVWQRNIKIGYFEQDLI